MEEGLVGKYPSQSADWSHLVVEPAIGCTPPRPADPSTPASSRWVACPCDSSNGEGEAAKAARAAADNAHPEEPPTQSALAQRARAETRGVSRRRRSCEISPFTRLVLPYTAHRRRAVHWVVRLRIHRLLLLELLLPLPSHHVLALDRFLRSPPLLWRGEAHP